MLILILCSAILSLEFTFLEFTCSEPDNTIMVKKVKRREGDGHSNMLERFLNNITKQTNKQNKMNIGAVKIRADYN